MRVKKSASITIRVPKDVKTALEQYIKVYDKEVCKPDGEFTDMSKMVRALLVTFLMKKGLLGFEFKEYANPCYSERVVEE